MDHAIRGHDVGLDHLGIVHHHGATSQPALRDRYTIYCLVRDVLRGNSTPDDGFSVRILQRVREERIRIEPGYDPLADELP